MTVFSFAVGAGLGRWRASRSWLLPLGIAGCLAPLAVYKYADFAATELARAVGAAGGAWHPSELDFVLPLGISFFTFQALSYLIDVHRGESAEPSLSRYALYLSFFPQLVAGPIVRARELLPQLRTARTFDPSDFDEGVWLLLRGLIKKAVLADSLAIWSDQVFAGPASVSTLGTWVGLLAYTGQIYCDFSGYTDIARGCGRMLGYRLPENFDLPYLASSPADFWRRWHMTLSSWLRDYLYIPLGGNRRGRARTYANLGITMLLGGLWHGAQWHFVVWGAYHGALLALHRLWLSATREGVIAHARSHAVYHGAAVCLMFCATAFGWIFFRAESLPAAGEFIAALFDHRTGDVPYDMRLALVMLALLAAGHGLGARRLVERTYSRIPGAARGAVWAAMVSEVDGSMRASSSRMITYST